ALAPDAAESVAAGGDRAPPEVHVDVVPVIERLVDFAPGLGIGNFEIAHGLVGEHHTPAEGVIGTIALHHGYVVRRVALFHKEREIQAGGATADADDAHGNRHVPEKD